MSMTHHYAIPVDILLRHMRVVNGKLSQHPHPIQPAKEKVQSILQHGGGAAWGPCPTWCKVIADNQVHQLRPGSQLLCCQPHVFEEFSYGLQQHVHGSFSYVASFSKQDICNLELLFNVLHNPPERA